jgi:hypothetical protein
VAWSQNVKPIVRVRSTLYWETDIRASALIVVSSGLLSTTILEIIRLIRIIMSKKLLENIQKYQTLLVGVVIISILGFSFYWYEYRDYALVKKCEALADIDPFDFSRRMEFSNFNRNNSKIGRYKVPPFPSMRDCLKVNNLN